MVSHRALFRLVCLPKVFWVPKEIWISKATWVQMAVWVQSWTYMLSLPFTGGRGVLSFSMGFVFGILVKSFDV